MKKLLSMLLCLLLLTLVLVSCGDNTTTKPKAERPNLTLRMAIVVDDKTTDEGVAAMQKAFNDKCEVLLATHIEFECIKASEYKSRMTEIMNEVANESAKQEAGKEDAMANAGTSTGTELEENQSKYPAASKGQFDILLIADEEMYEEYVRKGWLVGLDSYLKGSFKTINTKIHATAKELSMVDGVCYGIPANKAYGSYQYVMINKEAADYYQMEVNAVHSLSDACQLINMMENAQAGHGLSYWQERYEGDFSVFGMKEEDFVLRNVQYVSRDLKTPTLFGVTYGYSDIMSTMPDKARNLLKNSEYVKYLTMKFKGGADQKNYFSTDGNEENFLIGLVDGDYALRFSNDDYYFASIMNPTFEREELFGGMLAVSKFTVDEKRSLEIVQELMTDANRADLLNIALFGDEQSNYYMENGCVVYRNQSQYGVADGYLFGNLRELALPCADLGQTDDAYKYVSEQLSDLGQRLPLFNDNFAAYFAKIDTEKWEAFDAYCVEKYNELMASADLAAFQAKITSLVEEMSENELFSTMAHETVSDNDSTYETLGGCYYKYRQNAGAAPNLGTTAD